MAFNPRNLYLKRLGNFKMSKKSSTHIFIEARTTVGRNLNSKLLLRGGKASKEHAIIEFRNEKMFIKDLNTKVGTFINGRRIKDYEAELFEGTIVGFGYNHTVNLHMSDEKSSIYQVMKPILIEIDSDVEIIEKELENDQNSNNGANEDRVMSGATSQSTHLINSKCHDEEREVSSSVQVETPVPEPRLTLIIPPMVNQSLLNVQKAAINPNVIAPKTFALSAAKNIDRSSLVTQNTDDLVELAKNLQGGSGIQTKTSEKTISNPQSKSSEDESSKKQTEITKNPVTAKIPFPSLSPHSSDEDEESLMEEIPGRRIVQRRESVKRTRRRQGWSTNPGMVKKIPVRKTRPSISMPGNERRISVMISPEKPQSSEATSPEANESTEKVKTSPEKQSDMLKKRRKSIMEQQNELVSENDTLKEKVEKLRHWKRPAIQLIDPKPMLARRRGRRRQDSL